MLEKQEPLYQLIQKITLRSSPGIKIPGSIDVRADYLIKYSFVYETGNKFPDDLIQEGYQAQIDLLEKFSIYVTKSEE